MGYYIPNNIPITERAVEEIKKPENLSDIPEDKALIIDVDNGAFHAYGLVYDEREFKDFTYPSDVRRKRYFLMDKIQAHKLSDYKQI